MLIHTKLTESLHNLKGLFKRKSKQIDTYSEYLPSNMKSAKFLNNSRNLFDDSNEKNDEWLEVAKKFLTKKRQI